MLDSGFQRLKFPGFRITLHRLKRSWCFLGQRLISLTMLETLTLCTTYGAVIKTSPLSYFNNALFLLVRLYLVKRLVAFDLAMGAELMDSLIHSFPTNFFRHRLVHKDSLSPDEMRLTLCYQLLYLNSKVTQAFSQLQVFSSKSQPKNKVSF